MLPFPVRTSLVKFCRSMLGVAFLGIKGLSMQTVGIDRCSSVEVLRRLRPVKRIRNQTCCNHDAYSHDL